jgi:CRP-like cAMP-binding protein
MFEQITDKSNRITRKYKKDSIIFKDGDSTHEMFIIKSGEISIEKNIGSDGDNIIQLAQLKKGNFFGEMSMIEGLPRSATARAITDAEVQIVHSGSFLVIIQKDPTFAFEIINTLSGRIRQMNDNLINVIKEAGVDAKATKNILNKLNSQNS